MKRIYLVKGLIGSRLKMLLFKEVHYELELP